LSESGYKLWAQAIRFRKFVTAFNFAISLLLIMVFGIAITIIINELKKEIKEDIAFILEKRGRLDYCKE